MNQKIQKVSIKGIVCHDGKIFMLKDQGGKWELPGGRIDFGEHPKETLEREFVEELGIRDVQIGDIINIWDFTVNAKGDDYHFILVVFECKADLSNISISDEHLEHMWVALDDVANYPMRDGYTESIKKFRKLKDI